MTQCQWAVFFASLMPVVGWVLGRYAIGPVIWRFRRWLKQVDKDGDDLDMI